MNNVLKILTIAGAGLIIGGVAGTVIKMDIFRQTRSSKVAINGDQQKRKNLIAEADKQAEEIENYFI